MTTLPHNTQFDDLTILGAIADGGAATVYEAFDNILNHRVALKMVHQQCRDTVNTVRLKQEFAVLAKFQHPNVVRAYRAGLHEECWPYLVMELLEDGATLQERLDDSNNAPFDLARVSDIVEQCAGALHAAHENGIIHRDIKPSNIWLSNDGVVKILDFGGAKCSKSIRRATFITATGTTIGTAPYMSPEQLMGKPVSPASDTYSLAIVAYQLITGYLPWELMCEDNALPHPTQLRGMICEADVPRIGEWFVNFPRGISDVIARAMMKDPHLRPSSTVEFAEQLKDAITSVGLHDEQRPTIPDRASCAESQSFKSFLDAPECAGETPRLSTTPTFQEPSLSLTPVRRKHRKYLQNAPLITAGLSLIISIIAVASVLRGNQSHARRAVPSVRIYAPLASASQSASHTNNPPPAPSTTTITIQLPATSDVDAGAVAETVRAITKATQPQSGVTESQNHTNKTECDN